MMIHVICIGLAVMSVPLGLLVGQQANRQMKYLEEKRDLMHLRHEQERREEDDFLRRYTQEYALACIATAGRSQWQEVGELLRFIPDDGGLIHPDDPSYPRIPPGASAPLYGVRVGFRDCQYAFFLDCGDAGVRLIPAKGALVIREGSGWPLEEVEDALVAMDALVGAA